MSIFVSKIPLTKCVKSVTLKAKRRFVHMPTRNPRINVVLEEPLYAAIERLAKRDKVSLSLKVRDLVKEALDVEEDIALSIFAEERDKTFRKATALKHDEVW
jgi:hypothetical protein